MGRAPCCDEKLGLKKGPWTPDEDQKLVSYIRQHGHGSWRALPEKAGLKRCGKSCRLRWTNYLRPDIKRGRFSLEEDRIIIQLHAILGNRWSAIASHLPRRTDNEIKNYWNTHLKKRLTKMGIDPTTHLAFTTTQLPSANRPPPLATPPWTPLLPTQLTHMTQWDLTLAEAQARLSSPFLQPFAPPPTVPAPPASPHPSAFFLRSWKTQVEDALQPKLGAVKLEPKFHTLQDWVPSLAPASLHTMATGVLADTMALGDVTLTEKDAEIFVARNRLFGVSGSAVGEFQNGSITESPTSVLHGPDSDATSSPCGSATSDCFDLVRMHQSMMQNFPAVPGNGDHESSQCGALDTFWQRQHAAMVEAMRPDDMLVLDGSASAGCISELVVPLDFSAAEFPQFEILCQGEQYQADCALEC